MKIFEMLKKCKGAYIDLRYCDLNDDNISIVLESIKQNDCITSLDLRDNNLTSKSLFYIFNVLGNKFSQCIEEIYLGYNKFCALAENINTWTEISFCKLKVLTINDNQLLSEDLDIWANFIVKQKKLQHLDISCNNLDESSVQTITNIVKQNQYLESLYLSYNPKINGKIAPLGQIIGNHKKLKTLYVRCLNLGDEGCDLLTKTLSNNKSLKTLNLGDNSITNTGFASICENLKKNTTLECLNLGRNLLTPNAMLILANFLQTNTTVNKYNFGKNEIGDTGLQVLAQNVLHQKLPIKMFNLRDNAITDAGVDSLILFLEQLPILENINVCDNAISSSKILFLHTVLKRKKFIKFMYVDGNVIDKQAIKELTYVSPIVVPFLKDRSEIFCLQEEAQKSIDNLVKINANYYRDTDNLLPNSIYSIVFDGKKLTNAEIEKFANLFENRKITALSFRNCEISPFELPGLLSKLDIDSVKYLDFRHNNLGKEGAKLIAKKFCNSKELEFVDLSYNYVGFEFIEEISRYHHLDRTIWKF